MIKLTNLWTNQADKKDERANPTLDEFRLAMGHAEKLTNRRQVNMSPYLSVNITRLAIISLLLKEAGLAERWVPFSVLLLAIAGVIACLTWRSLLYQYKILLN